MLGLLADWKLYMLRSLLPKASVSHSQSKPIYCELTRVTPRAFPSSLRDGLYYHIPIDRETGLRDEASEPTATRAWFQGRSCPTLKASLLGWIHQVRYQWHPRPSWPMSCHSQPGKKLWVHQFPHHLPNSPGIIMTPHHCFCSAPT